MAAYGEARVKEGLLRHTIGIERTIHKGIRQQKGVFFWCVDVDS